MRDICCDLCLITDFFQTCKFFVLFCFVTQNVFAPNFHLYFPVYKFSELEAQISLELLNKLPPFFFLPTTFQGSQYELKDSPGSHPASLPVHTAQGFYPYGQYPYGDPSRAKTATRETTSTLKAWLQEHQKNPYPTKGEKIMLAIITRMTLTQVDSVICFRSSICIKCFSSVVFLAPYKHNLVGISLQAHLK